MIAAATALALVLPGSASAQDDTSTITPEGASGVISQVGSIFLTGHSGFGRSGVFNTQGGQWVQDPQRGLTYVCDVRAAVIPTTPGADRGVMYTGRLTVFRDPQTGTIRVEGGSASEWNRSTPTVSELHQAFPETSANGDVEPDGTAAGDSGDTAPPDDSDVPIGGDGLIDVIDGGSVRPPQANVAVAAVPSGLQPSGDGTEPPDDPGRPPRTRDRSTPPSNTPDDPDWDCGTPEMRARCVRACGILLNMARQTGMTSDPRLQTQLERCATLLE